MNTARHGIRSAAAWIIDLPLQLVLFALIAMSLLSWAIAPDCFLEFNKTAVWTQHLLNDLMGPVLQVIRPILPKGGYIHARDNPMIMDYSPMVAACFVGVARRCVRRVITGAGH